MKTKLAFLCLVTLLFLGSCVQQKRNPLEGAWQIISGEIYSGDTLQTMMKTAENATEIKMFTKTYYSFIGQIKSDTTTLDLYGVGTYTLDGTHCEEIISTNGIQAVEGSGTKMLVEIKNDTMIQKWPCDDNWEIGSDYYIQRWVRLE